MKLLNIKLLATMAFAAFTLFLGDHSVFAQERVPVETQEMEMQRDKMAYEDYNKDVHSRYHMVMDQVDRIQKQMVEKNINNPSFRKALSKFEARAKKFNAHMETASSIPADKQEKFRKEMRSELQKLHKEYNRLLDRWEKIKG
ncbi:MAG: hypothetical protein ABIO46_11010 [Chitinophagales bacterium]